MEEVLKSLMGLSIFVLPIWLFLHYRFKIAQAKYGLPQEEIKRLKALQVTAEHLQERVEALESILDSKVPDWRRQR